MRIRDRIKELRRVRAKDLLPNPKNWRTHPDRQRDALKGLLAEIGFADALLARETPDGLMLIDGHLRAETTPDAKVPVLVLDVTEAEADKLLATLDPLAALAQTNQEQLDGLLENVSSTNAAVAGLLSDLSNEAAIPPETTPPDEFPTYDEDLHTDFACPKCGHTWSGKPQ
jgi:hypothetical protein